MPTTYNGVGTRYYGKKNIQKRAAACPHCGNKVELTSYDTRLWFVILFIPVIPLGRKRIIDYCPACTRHYAVEADKWETSKQLEISGAQDKFRASQLPEDAMALHQQMMTYHQLEEAAEFRKTMREKFPDNAKVHAYLGASLEHFGKLEEADAMFGRALELRPDMPEARIGVAQAHLRAGRLDEARKLLDFMEKPGAAQLYLLEPLNKLAQALQKANRHDEALALFAILQRELPDIADKKWFRDLVKKSEKALKRGDSQLPKQKFSWKRLFQGDGAVANNATPQLTWKSLLVVGIIIAVVLLGFVVANEYIRRHRTLIVVNDFAQPALVEITGVKGTRTVLKNLDVPLAEGCYHARITGPVTEEVDFEVRSSYFDRWFSDPAWVLNVGGKAIIICNEVTYSREEIPARVSIHYGKRFEVYPKVTHAFRELPETLRMKSGESRTLVQLDLHKGDATDIVEYYDKKGDVHSALDFGETWLRSYPDDDQMLQSYTTQALRAHQTNQLDKFLRTGMTNRPVRTEWHRAYQQVHNNAAGHSALVAEYQALLFAEPTNSAFLYLCGRLESDRAAAINYFERAQRYDPSNTYPAFALAYDRMNAADWPAARRYIEQVVKLRPQNPTYQALLMTTRLAMGEFADIEKESRDRLKRDPANYPANLRLADALIRENRREDAQAVCKAFAAVCPAHYGRQAPAVAKALRCHVLYELGDFPELEKQAGNTGAYRFQALVEEGRLADALKSMPTQSDEDEGPLTSLILGLAYRQAGDVQQADHWVDQARAVLARGNENYMDAARLLARSPERITLEEVNNVVLPFQMKAVLVAHLAQLNTPVRSELAGLARQLNVERTFPYHLIQRATEPVK